MDQNKICYSIMEYMSDHSGYRCGYCKSSDTNFSHGMWAHRLNAYTYYHLINRGWRRSGKYCYKPTMDKTCCPQYTIRCDSDNFKLSKSQKKVLKRMHSFLSIGTKKVADNEKDKVSKIQEQYSDSIPQNRNSLIKDQEHSSTSLSKILEQYSDSAPQNRNSLMKDQEHSSTSLSEKTTPFKPGLGYDPSRPLCKRAKLQRMERRASKLSSASDPTCLKQISAPKTNQEKTLEDHLNSPLPEFPAHKLEVRLLLASPHNDEFAASFDESYHVYKKYQMVIHGEPELKCTKSRFEGFLCDSSLQLRLVPVSFHDTVFARTFSKSYELFKKYQMKVHGDSPNECDEASYKNFLIDGPLWPYKSCDGPENGYGPFHQQYWLDEELIAVGVLDILPSAVSSVYFFYDPKFAHLSLGTYSSIREIALTRALSRSSASVWCYYMGFYIHSCPKMRYKGQFVPSFLLCPETYEWAPIEICLPKLDIRKYSKLTDIPQPRLHLDINKIQCLYDGSRILYENLKRDSNYDKDDDEEVTEYLTLVGQDAAGMMLLYRS